MKRKISITSNTLSFPYSETTIEVSDNSDTKASVSWYTGDKLLFHTGNPEQLKNLTWKTERTTEISDGTFSIKTPEHLAPVFLLWKNLFFKVFVSESIPELPILDGSALPWFLALRKIAKEPTEIPFYKISDSFSFEHPYGFCSVTPSDTFEVEYSLKQKNFEDEIYYSVYAPEDLWNLFLARTFIFKEDFEILNQKGKLHGVTKDSGLLLKPENGKYIPENTFFRNKKEPLFHKILDLVGDLSLFTGALPLCKIRIHNGGHETHRQIFKRLVNYV